MNSKQYNTGLAIVIIIAISLFTTMFSACSSTSGKDNKQASKEIKSNNPSIRLRATNLLTNTVEHIILSDSLNNIYKKGDNVWVLNNIIQSPNRILLTDMKHTEISRLVRIEGYIKHRIEED